MSSPAPTAAKPTKHLFDPFNSSATGHQRADNRLSGSTSWRDSRNFKLKHQFTSGIGGGARVPDTVGAGSIHFGRDGRTENGGWMKGAKGLRRGGQTSILESMKGIKVKKPEMDRSAKRVKLEEKDQPTSVVNPFTPFRRQDGTLRESSWKGHGSPSDLLTPLDIASTPSALSPAEAQNNTPSADREAYLPIFSNLIIYVNGSTAPAISDHKLKHLLSSHGANLSIALGRRKVTHVIVGRPNSSGGSGGGLSGSKIHKEIARVGGKGIKFVSVEWILESVKAGRRLPETRFAMPLAPAGVKSVAGMFVKATSKEAAR